MINWRLHFENAALPLGMMVTLVVMELLWKPLGLPPMQDIVAFLKDAFATYGLWALFFSAIIEAIFVVSFYLPGSLVIFSAILLSERTLPELSGIFAICWIAFMIAAVINYAIGYYGLYRFFNALGAKRLISSTQGWMQKYGKLTYALAAFHPNYISIVEVCGGISRQGLMKTLIYAGCAIAGNAAISQMDTANPIAYGFIGSAMSTMFGVFIGLFGVWALCVISKGIYDDLTSPTNLKIQA